MLSPLEIAAETDCCEVVVALLEAGADIPTDSQALIRAVGSRCSPEIVKLLILAGANVDFTTPKYETYPNWTPLQIAATRGDRIVVNLLLEAGANIDAPAAQGRGPTALSTAILRQDKWLIKRLLDLGVDVNNPCEKLSGGTALAYAVANKDFELTAELLALGADINDHHALLQAVTSNTIECTRLLLAAGKKTAGSRARSYGCAALGRAIEMHSWSTVEILLEAGVNVNAPAMTPEYWVGHSKGRFGILHLYTPLGAAIRHDRYESVPYLREVLRAGGDPRSIVDYNAKRTALGLAIACSNMPAAELLVQLGADVNVRCGGQKNPTPLQAASAKGSTKLVHLLLSAGAIVNAPATKCYPTALQGAIATRNMDRVQMLLEAGADVNAAPMKLDGLTALQECAGLGYVGIACILLEKGAEVNAPRTEFGRTALEAAAEEGRVDMLRLLLDAGAENEGPGEEQYQNALRYALENHHFAAHRLLEQAGKGKQ